MTEIRETALFSCQEVWMRFSNKEIIEMSKGGFFGEGNAQLPSSLMLMIDEIEKISTEGESYNKGQLDASLKILPVSLVFRVPLSRRPSNARLFGFRCVVAASRRLLGLVRIKG